MNKEIYRLMLGGEAVAVVEGLRDSYDSVAAMLKAVKAPATILIDGLRAVDDHIMSKAFDAVYRLRRSDVFYAAPVYLTKPLENLEPFVDGVSCNPAAIRLVTDPILAKLGSVPVDVNAGNDELRLLTFLFCRGEEALLSPLALSAAPSIYEYPAAFLIGDFAAAALQTAFRTRGLADTKTLLRSSAEWVASLGAQGFLAAQGLVDRIRICPQCNTGNLNYIDSCPLCGSIDFAKTRMIHCFTCGHVAPEDHFKNDMMFSCPRCNVKLRHIGSDYDRPVEAYLCSGCGERFIEPEVNADCLKCRKKTATEELIVRQVYHYGMTAKGKRAVQLGSIYMEFSLFDNNRNVMPLYFYQMVDWLLQMKLRYSDEDFSLLCIRIAGFEPLETTAGINQFQKIIDELALRIRELVRSTDLTTSTGENTFWVLLPRTNQKGGEILASRVEKLADMVSLTDGAQIRIQVKCFSLPTEYANRGPVAERLLGEYQTALADTR
ncbi:MAG TPA: diguanylate cyclase [Patescibacteria group bacterium]|nr:diguanylate cyclase [Patescibacteria group bacterium]